MPRATLTINSRNHGAWSLRGWLSSKLAGLDVEITSTASSRSGVGAWSRTAARTYEVELDVEF